MSIKSKKSVFSRTVIATAVAFGAVFTMAACSDDDLSPGGTPYFLTSVAGEELPLIDSVVRDGEGEEGYSVYRLSSGTVRLMAAERFSLSFAVDTGATLTNLSRHKGFDFKGRYTVDEEDNTITFSITEPAEAALTGTFRNDSIVLNQVLDFDDVVFVKR